MTESNAPDTPGPGDEPTDEWAWERLQLVGANARRYLVKWSRATDLQARRVLTREDSSFDDREIDAWQFCVAARQVRRAADMIIRDLGNGSDMLQTFDDACPGVIDARDAIDHFDDYARGTGNLAHPGVRPGKRQPNENAARRFEPRYIEHADGRATITVGENTVDVAITASAVARLVQSLLEAVGFATMGNTPELPPFNPADPLGYAVMLSYISTSVISEEDYGAFLKEMAEDPELWPTLSELRADLSNHRPTSRTRHFAGNQQTALLVPKEYEGRIVTADSLNLVGCWHVILVPKPDGSWRIRGYTRDSASYRQLKELAEEEASGL